MDCLQVSRSTVAIVQTPPSNSEDIPLHRPAMVRQILECTTPHRARNALDLTVGTGGHALAIGQELGPEGFLLGLDRDRTALQAAKRRLTHSLDCRFRLFRCPFSRARQAAEEVGVESFDLVLADLGVGSHQLEDPARGFSYESDISLDMRYDTSEGMTARDVINTLPRDRLADIFYNLGEERYSRQIADAICSRRERQPVETAAELAEIIKRVAARRSGGRRWRLHPATRVMMALRIYVNRELEELEALLHLLPGLLHRGSKACILTYHSLEARRVKQAWQELEEKGLLKILTPSPLTPSEEEIQDNPRVRSCQLRAAEWGREGGAK